MSAVDFAKRAIKANLSVVPVRPGGKLPASKWKTWQSSIMELAEVDSFFTRNDLGIICGAVSGGVECLDFDDPDAFHEWKEFISNHGYEDTLNSCYIQQTPSGGWHVVYRTDSLQGNLKLAWGSDLSSDKAKIETRGEGGYFKCYPSKGYQAQNSNLLDLPKLNSDEHDAFIGFARMLTEKITDKECGTAIPGSDSDTPGMDFVKRGNWDEILTPHGWTVSHKRGEITYWVRPGKTKRDGISATTGHAGLDYFYVFTTSTSFTSGRAYNKFAVFAYLNHGGDFNTAARELKKAGFGKQAEGVPPLTKSQEREPEKYTPSTPSLPLPKLSSLADHSAGVPDFLWEPYIRFRAINLLDAKGGSGKTTLSIMLGAAGSVGLLPYGVQTEPFSTLYFGGEDDPGELRTLFDRVGGDPSRFHVVSDPFRLDQRGLKFVEQCIKETGAKLVIFDALKYYLAGLVFNQLDDMQVAPHLANLKKLAWETNTAILNIRHFRKNADLTRLDEAGQGNEQWRNSHRSQLVMLRHPDEPGMSICLHKKSNLLTPEGDAFAFQIQRGEYVWVPKDYIDLSFLDASQKSGGTKSSACVDWLRSFLGDKENGEYLSEIRRKAEMAGFKVPQLYNAKKELGLIDEKVGGAIIWKINDPFCD